MDRSALNLNLIGKEIKITVRKDISSELDKKKLAAIDPDLTKDKMTATEYKTYVARLGNKYEKHSYIPVSRDENGEPVLDNNGTELIYADKTYYNFAGDILEPGFSPVPLPLINKDGEPVDGDGNVITDIFPLADENGEAIIDKNIEMIWVKYPPVPTTPRKAPYSYEFEEGGIPNVIGVNNKKYYLILKTVDDGEYVKDTIIKDENGNYYKPTDVLKDHTPPAIKKQNDYIVAGLEDIIGIEEYIRPVIVTEEEETVEETKEEN